MPLLTIPLCTKRLHFSHTTTAPALKYQSKLLRSTLHESEKQTLYRFFTQLFDFCFLTTHNTPVEQYNLHHHNKCSDSQLNNKTELSKPSQK